MALEQNNLMAKGGVALAHERVVLLKDPRKPANLAPLLEDVSRLGAGVPDTEESRAKIESGMRSFRSRCTGLLDKLVYLHALRFGEGYYEDHDPQMKEQDRMTVLICYAIYVSTRMESAHSRVMELDDSGASALFATALKEANGLFAKGASRMEQEELVRRFGDTEPLLSASLSRCGLRDQIVPNMRIFDELKFEALRRVNAAMDRIYGPEEAA